MNLVKWVLGILLGLLIIAGALLFGARFADGPIELIPGGPLKAGELRPTPEDWDFAHAVQEIEFESGGRSRTSWIVVDAGDAFIPASTQFPPMKRWHKEALTDPVAVVRIDGVRYPVSLARVPPDSPRFDATLKKLAEKYAALPGSEGADPKTAVWLFELRRRS